VTDPTPEPLRDAHDDLCADDLGGEHVRNIYVRRVGEALDDDGAALPLVVAPVKPGRAARDGAARATRKRKDR
jgi:hypothetical protein